MSIKKELADVAEYAAQSMQAMEPQLQQAIADLNSQLSQKKLELEQTHAATQRASDFETALAIDLYCPECWVRGHRHILKPVSSESAQDRWRCPSCWSEFCA
jgi:transposase-like protein